MNAASYKFLTKALSVLIVVLVLGWFFGPALMNWRNGITNPSAPVAAPAPSAPVAPAAVEAPAKAPAAPVIPAVPDWAVLTVTKGSATWSEIAYFRNDYDYKLLEIIQQESLTKVKDPGNSTASINVPSDWYVAVFFDGGSWKGKLGNPAPLNGANVFSGQKLDFTFFGNPSSGVRIVMSKDKAMLDKYVADFIATYNQ